MYWKGVGASPGGYRTYPEWTLRITLFAVILGVITTVASVYSGLKLAQVVPASAVAVLLGLLFKLRRGTILEVNMGQILTSTINVSAAGVIFTIPALFIMFTSDQLAATPQFNTLNLMVACIAGAVMGAAIIVPMRRRFIEVDALPFPSGTANATVVRVLGIPVRSIVTLVCATIAAALVAQGKQAGFYGEELTLGDWLGLPGYTGTAISVSLLTLGIGFLGGKGGLPFLIGGIVGWLIVGPFFASEIVSPETIAKFNPAYQPGGDYAAAVGGILLPKVLRPLGVGMFFGAAILGALLALPVLRGVVRSMRTVRSTGSEMPLRTIGLIMAVGVVALFFVAAGSLPLWRAALVVIIGTAYMVVANMVGTECTGRTAIGPVSGLSFLGAIITYLLSGGNLVVAVFMGAAICSGITQGGDMMDDLKTAHLIGGNAWRAQVSQILFAGLGPVVALLTVLVLAKSVGFGEESVACAGKQVGCLPAPQATALSAVLGGLAKQGLAWDLYGGGALLGGLLTLLPVGGVGVLFGLAFYLPFSITLTYGIGSLLQMALKRWKGDDWILSYGVPAAAGAILGESLVDVYHALHAATGILGN